MAMSREEFKAATGISTAYVGYGVDEAHLPCFAHRWWVNDRVNTPKLIDAYIALASETDHNDVLVFSVTERDACWKVWKAYAKAHPRKFKVVEGGSIHGVYLCRMYIYTKPAKQRKFHADNIGKYHPR